MDHVLLDHIAWLGQLLALFVLQGHLDPQQAVQLQQGQQDALIVMLEDIVMFQDK
jgi:hypothetical protein